MQQLTKQILTGISAEEIFFRCTAQKMKFSIKDYTAQKMKFSIKDLRKLHFLCSDVFDKVKFDKVYYLMHIISKYLQVKLTIQNLKDSFRKSHRSDVLLVSYC